MKIRLNRLPESFFNASTLQRFKLFPIYFAAIFFLSAISRAQNGWQPPTAIHSVSGQFIVSAAAPDSPFLRQPDLTTNTDFIRLTPALLAISAERFKIALWQQLGFQPNDNWSGKIFLVIFPARTLDDSINIRILNGSGWAYRVDLPDVVTRNRYSRALAAVSLLEIANRGNRNPAHSAEIPSWLGDGLAQHILNSDPEKIFLSAPNKSRHVVPINPVNQNERNFNPLTAAHATLENFPALTFDQLCWPSDLQMNGADNGVYLASAQLFVADLLALKNGPEKMRAFLAALPNCMNWQTAFFSTFAENFRRPLDVEKWWSLRAVDFAAHDPGPHWNLEISRERFEDLLSVPVAYRSTSNSLPTHAAVSLQEAVENFSPAARRAILEVKLRDIELAQFRLATPFASLAGGYRAALADFLGERKNFNPFAVNRRGYVAPRANLKKTLQTLDELDARRRALEQQMDLNPLRQK